MEKQVKFPTEASERLRVTRENGSVVTPFQYKVYDALLLIPPGKVWSLYR